MKDFVKIFLLSLSLTFLTSPSYAKIGLTSIGVEFGYYGPDMDYWNSSRIKTWDEQFNGSMLNQLNLDFEIAKCNSFNFIIRGSAGYWKETVSQDGLPIGLRVGTQEIAISLIPLTGTVIIEKIPVSSLTINFYTGIGGGMNLITKQTTRTPEGIEPTVDKNDGYDYTYHFIIGFKKEINNTPFSIGIESREIVAKYLQKFKSSAGEVTEESISLSGSQVSLSINYLLGKKTKKPPLE